MAGLSDKGAHRMPISSALPHDWRCAVVSSPHRSVIRYITPRGGVGGREGGRAGGVGGRGGAGAGEGHCVHGRRKGRCKLQGLRYGLLRARAPEGSLQGLQCIGNRQQAIDNSQQTIANRQ
jgi:hypothetical protein